MTDQDPGVIDELNDLLENERHALLSGDLDEVGRVLDTKEKLLRALAENPAANKVGLDKLKVKLSRNQELIESAMSGIQAVAQRFETIRKVRESLETYDRSGQKRLIEVAKGKRLEKRA